MEIIGFLQIRNEESSGHLDRFIKINLDLFDKLYVYDDASTDNTANKLSKYATGMIVGAHQRFQSELISKSLLLDLIKRECKFGDAIIHLDADEALYCSKSELRNLIEESFQEGYDSISLPHINLWRSYSWYRTDSNYNDLEPTRIWKLSEKLNFPNIHGLHVTTEPRGLKRTRVYKNFPVVHFGFCTLDLILDKHEHYRRHWQKGYALSRLISEKSLTMENIWLCENDMGARFQALHEGIIDDAKPKKLSEIEWNLKSLAQQKSSTKETEAAKVTLVSLIYASIEWLEFQYSELLKLRRDLPRGDVEILFVANDATDEVLNFLIQNNIPHINVNTKENPDEWFINSVYRAYNLGVESAKTEYVYLVNSDMAYTRGTLSNIMQLRSPNKFISSRLVESGVMPSGIHGIERNFGAKPRRFRRRHFERYAKKIGRPEIHEGGLYMPILIHRDTFLNLGGYPEGNICTHSVNDYFKGAKALIAKKGDDLIPGDQAFIEKAKINGVSHITAFDSITYHFQAGERRSSKDLKKVKSGIAVINDSHVGINGEEVLWGKLIEILQSLRIKVLGIESGFPKGRLSHLLNPIRLMFITFHDFSVHGFPRVVFANGTYMFPTLGKLRRSILIQDKPSGRINIFLQKLNLLFSDSIITNDPKFQMSNYKKGFDWLLVPLAIDWWVTSTATNASNRTAIFVGSFSEVKGWAKIKDAITSDSSIYWILVSKYENDDHGLGGEVGENWEVKRNLNQKDLNYELNRANVLVSNSPYETQHLASLEAASQGVPVITTATGLLGAFGPGVHPFGIVTENFLQEIRNIFDNKYSFDPRSFVQSLNLIGTESWEPWLNYLLEQLEESFIDITEPNRFVSLIYRLWSYVLFIIRSSLRKFIQPYFIRIIRLIK